MRADSHSREQKNPATYFGPFISLFMSSPGCRYSSATSAAVFPACHRRRLVEGGLHEPPVEKVSHHLRRPRTSPPPPHARQSVRKNLHGGNRKCQRAGSMTIRAPFLRVFWAAAAARFRGIGRAVSQKTNRTSNGSRLSRNAHTPTLARVRNRGRPTFEGIRTTKKAAPPLPDRILGASSVSAGR